MLAKHRTKTGMMVVLVGIEIGILTKQTDSKARPATDKVDGYPLKKVMIALGTSIKIFRSVL